VGWGGHHSLSAIVQKAIREFLDKEDKRARREEKEGLEM